MDDYPYVCPNCRYENTDKCDWCGDNRNYEPKNMTLDTERALEIIRPFAREFNIKVDADMKCMYVDAPYLGKKKIGIACNSTYATLKEFIGVLMFRYDHDRDIELSEKQKSIIERYWRDDVAESEGTEE